MKTILRLLLVWVITEGCSAFHHNLWLNRFEVCCKIDTELLRDGEQVVFKDGFFQDKYVKLSFDYDILKGIKLRIINECLYISEINWDEAYYLDEYGQKHEIMLLENRGIKDAKNISAIAPYTDFEITLIPKDYVYKKDDIWSFRQMLDPSSHPEKLKGRTVSLLFNFPCDENIYNYIVNFKVIPRYSTIP